VAHFMSPFSVSAFLIIVDDIHRNIYPFL